MENKDYSKSVSTKDGAVSDLLEGKKFCISYKSHSSEFLTSLFSEMRNNILYANIGRKINIDEFKNMISFIKESYPNANIDILFISNERQVQVKRTSVGYGVNNYLNDKNDNYVDFYTFSTNVPLEYKEAKYIQGSIKNNIKIDKFYEILSLFSPKRIIRIVGQTDFVIYRSINIEDDIHILSGSWMMRRDI